jgi:hypothetical protein
MQAENLGVMVSFKERATTGKKLTRTLTIGRDSAL